MKLGDKVAIVTGGGRGLGRVIALRFAKEGAAVAVASCGDWERTLAVRAASLGKPMAEIEREFYVEPTALKRMLDPEEIAGTAVFLASDEAAGITGETLGVTAGFRL